MRAARLTTLLPVVRCRSHGFDATGRCRFRCWQHPRRTRSEPGTVYPKGRWTSPMRRPVALPSPTQQPDCPNGSVKGLTSRRSRVLSIGKLAAGQARYYLEQAEGRVDVVESVGDGIEDYYSGGAEARGEWIGSALSGWNSAALSTGPRFATCSVAGIPGGRSRQGDDPRTARAAPRRARRPLAPVLRIPCAHRASHLGGDRGALGPGPQAR